MKILKLFVRDERLGFLTFSLNNLDNTLQVSVHLKLEKFPKKPENFNELTDKLSSLKFFKLSDDEANIIYEVHNTKSLGYTEFETVKKNSNSIVELIDAEKSF